MINSKTFEILSNLKKYLLCLLDNGKNKLVYNDQLHDEKTIDCINAINDIISEYEKQIKINDENYKKLANLDKTNNDLRLLYRRTANKLMENGKDELARYFLAQIKEVPTFTVDSDIDYYEEYHKLQKENEEKDKYIKHSEEITTEMNEDINKLLIEIKEKDKQIDLMGEVIFKRFAAHLIIEYGIENKEQFINLFKNKIKEDKENE